MAGSQESICGAAVTIDCPTFQIEEIKALDFQLWFIDSLAQLLNGSNSPKLTVKLFEAVQGISNQVVITPTEISNLHETTSSKAFQLRLNLLNNDQVISGSYAGVLAMVKVILSAVKVLNKRKNLTYLPRLSIINSGEANLFLTITKTL